MQHETRYANGRARAVLVTALLALTTIGAVAPGFVMTGSASHPANHFDFDFNGFAERGPASHGQWTVSEGGAAVTQTLEFQYASLFLAGASQVGGPNYRDVVFAGEVEAPPAGANNNIIGLAFGLFRPTGGGTLVDAYILDWKAAEQTHIGHTAPEGFTFYRMQGQMPAEGAANFEDQQFACFWAKDDAACTSATITVLGSHTGVGTGWEHDATYHLQLRYDLNRVIVRVNGGTNYPSATNVINIASAGAFPEVGMFGPYVFRQEDVTFRGFGFRDNIAPTFDVETQCSEPGLDDWCLSEAQFRIINPTDHGSGVASAVCELGGEVIDPCDGDFQGLPGDGTYTVTATVTDARGLFATTSFDLKQDSQLQRVPWDDPNRFLLNMTTFTQVGDSTQGNWAVSGTTHDDLATQQTLGNRLQSFFVTNRPYFGTELVVNATAPPTSTGLFGFVVGHHRPLSDTTNGNHDTLILDWKSGNETLGGHTAYDGLTLYRVKGTVTDNLDLNRACFWAKNEEQCGAIEVLDTFRYDTFPQSELPFGWEPGADYEFRLLVRKDAVHLRVTGGSPGTLYFNGTDALQKGGLDLGAGHVGYYTYRQAGADWQNLTFRDRTAPEIGVATHCPTEGVFGWCADPIEIAVSALHGGSGVASVACTLDGVDIPGCADAPFSTTSDGEITLRVVSTDFGGNKRIRNEVLRVDTTQPFAIANADCTAQSGFCRSDVQLGADGEAPSGILGKTCQLRSGQTGSWGSVACTASVSEDGEYTLRTRVTSNVFRVSDWAFASFLRDGTKPTGSFLEPQEGCVHADGENLACTGLVTVTYGDVPVTVEASDPIVNDVASGMDRVEFHDDTGLLAVVAADGAEGRYAFTWTPSGPGERTLEARLYDAAGNRQVLELTADVGVPGLL